MGTTTVSTPDAAAVKEARLLAGRARWFAAQQAAAAAAELTLCRMAHHVSEFALYRGDELVASLDYIARSVDAARFGWVVRSTAVLPAEACGVGRHHDLARLAVRLGESVPATV